MDYSSVITKIKPSIALILAIDKEGKIMGTGSGFIFTKKNIMVTCNHVVAGANSFLLKFPDATQYTQGKVVIQDDEHDLALIKFSDNTRNPLIIGESDKVVEGMPVVFSGFPFNSKELTTHQGILSAITKDETGMTTYLIDGTVNPGNSGCPLMDSSGRVIGIVNARKLVRTDILKKIEAMKVGAVALHGVDLVEIYQALAGNLQLGIGAAVPVSYVPEHKEIEEIKKDLEENISKNGQ